MMKKVTKEWTEREDELLLEYWNTMTLDALFAVLPDRSRVEMSNRVYYLTRQNRQFKWPKR